MHWFIDPIKNHYADFDGRATRQQFGMYTLSYFILSVVVTIVAAIIDLQLLGTVLYLALLVPSWAIAIRRIHDLGRTGWWSLMFLVPLLNLALFLGLLIRKGDPAPNKYGVRGGHGVSAGQTAAASPELLNAVKERVVLGYDDEKIKAELRQSGYPEAAITSVLAQARGQTQAATQPAPANESSTDQNQNQPG